MNSRWPGALRQASDPPSGRFSNQSTWGRKRSNQERRMRFLSAALIALLFTATSQAQDTRGAIIGTVTDQQGASIAGAHIVVTNTDTNVATQLTTNPSGLYEARLLQPGKYQVAADASGFKKYLRSGLQI